MIVGRIHPVLLVALVFALVQCNTSKEGHINNGAENQQPTKRSKLFSISLQDANRSYTPTDSVHLHWNSKENQQPDSAVVQSDRFRAGVRIAPSTMAFSLSGISMGEKSFRLNIYTADSLFESHFVNLNVFAATPPVELSYSVLRKFWHDEKAYTQGLLYSNGFLYESTGQNGQSSLRKLDPQTGKVLQKKDIPNQFFSEGIALVKNQIYMLTYRSRLGFVFDQESFKEIRQFDFQSFEGWGLTYNGKHLIMSDGSSKLSFYNPEYLSLEYQTDVCTNRKHIGQLNELEYTPRGIFANVYTESVIVLINPDTGEVLATLNLSNLFPSGTPKDIDHVLNGIAWNPESNTYYVTGKYWPVMYEISIH